MSRRARARKNARPWLQQRDADDDSEIDALIASERSDDDTERAWQQREHEQQKQRSDA